MALIVITVSDNPFVKKPNFRFIKETPENEIVQQIEIIQEGNPEDDFLICVHFPSYPYIKKYAHQFPVLPFHHESSDEIYTALMKEDLEFFEASFFKLLKQQLILPFMPIHLSLQAFWGITTNDFKDSNKIIFSYIWTEEEKKWNAEQQEIKKKVKKIIEKHIDANDFHQAYQRLFPNPEAFQLVESARYDFYAPLFDFLLTEREVGIDKQLFNSNTPATNETVDLEKWDYEKPGFVELLEKINKIEFEVIIKALKTEAPIEPDEGEKTIFSLPQLKVSEISAFKFISCLKELGAILANTPPKVATRKIQCCSDGMNNYYGYKGKNREKITLILSGLAGDFRAELKENGALMFHCKLSKEKIKSSRACNKYIEGILPRQLIEWGVEKTMVVIGGIEWLVKNRNKESGE